ncbi:MAG: hypothetical protein BroJett040_22070 [Oligoflexia bacterium]|nr:MAG: hypothetical protein BroJett040_22070 [Oligoflexia bacterium]
MLIIILFALIPCAGFAQEVREFYNSARSLAMGNTSIAVVNDETALLHNPAGLGKLRDYYGTILDPEFDGATSLMSMYQKTPFSPFNLESVKGALDAKRESYYHARVQLFPSFVTRNFGIGIFGRYQLDAAMNAAGTTMSTAYYDDLALVLGYNFRFFEGRVKLGVAGRFVSRIEVNQDLDPTQNLALTTYGAEGAAVAADVGLILTGPWSWLPTISAVARDVGGTKFTAGKGLRLQTTNIPAPITQDIDVAVALFPIHASRARSSFTIEYQKMTAASQDANKTKYMHAGYELNLSDIFFIRGGMNGAYWTAGLELASEHTQIMLTTYGEEVGTSETPTENRRMVMKFSLRF